LARLPSSQNAKKSRNPIGNLEKSKSREIRKSGKSNAGNPDTHHTHHTLFVFCIPWKIRKSEILGNPRKINGNPWKSFLEIPGNPREHLKNPNPRKSGIPLGNLRKFLILEIQSHEIPS
jgi:hypothetical protein